MPRTLNQLAQILQEMYSNAPNNEKVIRIYLFGIKYAEDIKRVGIREVIEQSGLRISYRTELTKAVRLAQYVQPKAGVN